MKKILLLLTFAIVAAQILWLSCSYRARSVELATAPRLRIATRTYDPYDHFRGYYQATDAKFTLPISQAAAICGRSINRDRLEQQLLEGVSFDILIDKLPPVTGHSPTAVELRTEQYEVFPLAAYWSKQSSGLWQITRLEIPDSPEDKAGEGEVRLPMTAYWNMDWKGDTCAADLVLRFSGLTSLRYYYPEIAGDFFRILEEQQTVPQQKTLIVDISVELVARPDAPPFLAELYLNDIPYTQAAAMLQKGEFPFRAVSATPPQQPNAHERLLKQLLKEDNRSQTSGSLPPGDD